MSIRSWNDSIQPLFRLELAMEIVEHNIDFFHRLNQVDAPGVPYRQRNEETSLLFLMGECNIYIYIISKYYIYWILFKKSPWLIHRALGAHLSSFAFILAAEFDLQGGGKGPVKWASEWDHIYIYILYWFSRFYSIWHPQIEDWPFA